MGDLEGESVVIHGLGRAVVPEDVRLQAPGGLHATVVEQLPGALINGRKLNRLQRVADAEVVDVGKAVGYHRRDVRGRGADRERGEGAEIWQPALDPDGQGLGFGRGRGLRAVTLARASRSGLR